MTTSLKIIAALLLLFNGIGAIYGGSNLIIYPNGSSIQLSPHWLENTPFVNYFIPGIILFITNGLFSIFVLVNMLLNRKRYPLLIMAQGAILFGWIFIQINLIQTVYYLHYLMGGIGLILILLGWLLYRNSMVQE